MKKNIRFSLLTAAIACTAIAAVQMYRLPLWSWWTLLLLSSLWATWIFAALPLYSKHAQGLRWLGLSTLSGVLLAASFPMSPFTPLIFVAFVPLLLLLKEISVQELANKNRLVMRYTYNTMVWWNVLATWWVGNAGLIPGMIANFLNAFFMCLPILAYFVTAQKRSENWSLLALICYWFTWEYLHLSWDLSWPWLTLGNTFADKTNWVQWYEYTGVFGGGLWVLLLNILVFKILKTHHFSLKNAVQDWKSWKWAAATLILPILFSFLLLQKNNLTQGQAVEIVALQPNFEPHYQKFEISDEAQLERFLNLSKANVTQNTRYLILPETSFGVFDADHLNAYQPIQAFQNLADSFPKLHIISGLELFKIYAPSDTLPKTVRRKGNRCIEIYNAAVQLTHNQQNIPLYKKSKLVPGAEILPFRFAFEWLKPLFAKMGGTIEGLGPQPERSLFWDDKGNGIAPVICYESIYGEYCGDYIRHGAKALFVMTNDGWWDNTPGYRQHLAFSRLRAIEFRVPVVRAANTGACAFINEKGEVVSSTTYDNPTALKGTVTLSEQHSTFYALYGDVLAKIAIVISSIFLLLGLQKKLLRGK